MRCQRTASSGVITLSPAVRKVAPSMPRRRKSWSARSVLAVRSVIAGSGRVGSSPMAKTTVPGTWAPSGAFPRASRTVTRARRGRPRIGSTSKQGDGELLSGARSIPGCDSASASRWLLRPTPSTRPGQAGHLIEPVAEQGRSQLRHRGEVGEGRLVRLARRITAESIEGRQPVSTRNRAMLRKADP